MGCGLSKKEVRQVEEITGMSRKEVQDSFKAFKKEAGGTKIPLDKFTKLVASMNTNAGGKVDDYASHLFRVLDTDKDKKVSFAEVTVGFHHLSSAGDERERLRLIFKMLDFDDTKAISTVNVKTITKAQLEMQGKAVVDKEIDDKVSNFFGQCDLNKDGQITEDEFIKSGSKVSEIFELED